MTNDTAQTNGSRADQQKVMITPTTPPSSPPARLWEQIERDMEEMRHRMRALFRGAPAPARPATSPRTLDTFSWEPTTDVYEKGCALIVKAELPGVRKDAITISVEKGILTIAATRNEETESGDARYYIAERFSGSLQRSFQLPDGVDTTEIAATFRDGVLEVRVPLPEQPCTEPLQIGIKD